MHELALMQSLVDTVEERLDDARVEVVRLEIGQLTCVSADALRFCFDVCAAGSRLEGAALDIIQLQGQARCRSCALDVELPGGLRPCPCGSLDLEIQRGQELRLKELEVV